MLGGHAGECPRSGQYRPHRGTNLPLDAWLWMTAKLGRLNGILKDGDKQPWVDHSAVPAARHDPRQSFRTMSTCLPGNRSCPSAEDRLTKAVALLSAVPDPRLRTVAGCHAHPVLVTAAFGPASLVGKAALGDGSGRDVDAKGTPIGVVHGGQAERIQVIQRVTCGR